MKEIVKQTGGFNILLAMASFIIVVAGMRAASSLLVPFILAVFVSVICAPPLFWLQRKGVPRAVALALILVAIIAVGLLLGALIGSSLNRFVTSLPNYQDQISAKMATAIMWLHEKGIHIPEGGVQGIFSTQTVMHLAAGLLTGLSSVVTNAFLILLTVVFILLEAADLPKKLRVGLRKPEKSLANFEKFRRSANRYVVIKTLISAATGFTITLWLLVIGVDYPLLWGMLVFLLNYVPNIGSILAALPPTLLALIQFGPGSSLLTILGFLVVSNVFGNIVEPKLMGRGLGLSTLVVFISLVFWGWVLGPIGMVLSVPLTSLIKIALESNEETRGLAVILGANAEE